MGGDEQVVCADQGASPLQACANLRVVPGGIVGELEDLNVG